MRMDRGSHSTCRMDCMQLWHDLTAACHTHAPTDFFQGDFWEPVWDCPQSSQNSSTE